MSKRDWLSPLDREQNQDIPHVVSVIICAYTEERWGDLEKALLKVWIQTPPPDEVILVIDHNPVLLKKAQQTFLNTRVIPNQERRGLSGARNTGVKHAQGDIVVFLDEDAWPSPRWLERLVNAYHRPEVMGAGGSIQPDWDTGRPGWFPEEFDWVVGCTYRGMPTDISPVRNLIGANMSYRRTVFSEVSGFHPEIGRIGVFPAGGEETEFCIRLHQKLPESILLYIPEAVVHHRVPPARSKLSYFTSRCFAEGRSKAFITRLVGEQDGLDAERSYSLKTLPIGVLRNLALVLRGDVKGLQRAAAILIGLIFTTAGYLSGKLRLLTSPKTVSADGAISYSRVGPKLMQDIQKEGSSSSGRMRRQ
jgi:GT2 family glycosyltransferase